MCIHSLFQHEYPGTQFAGSTPVPDFMAYHNGQPFNENQLRPCPMLENPEKLRKMVAESQAHSTDLQSPESAEHLCEKCEQYAKNWQETADRLWKNSPKGKAEA